MQQKSVPQYTPMGADWPQDQSYQPQAQSYGQPQVQSYGQPQAQPYGQPQVQTYTQPYTFPQAQPYAQPQAQPYAQPQGQPYAQPQTQAPPVAPVSAPSSPAAAGGPGAQPSPQQQFARHLMGIARVLEQTIPGYQIQISLLLDLAASPKGQGVEALAPLLEQLQKAAFIHYGTLGAIRRFLVGEMTPDVLGSLAVGIQRLISLHGQTRPLWEQVLAGAAPEVRSALTNVNQAVTGAETLLNQAASGVQMAVGPQLWAAAQAKALEAEKA